MDLYVRAHREASLPMGKIHISVCARQASLAEACKRPQPLRLVPMLMICQQCAVGTGPDMNDGFRSPDPQSMAGSWTKHSLAEARRSRREGPFPVS